MDSFIWYGCGILTAGIPAAVMMRKLLKLIAWQQRRLKLAAKLIDAQEALVAASKRLVEELRLNERLDTQIANVRVMCGRANDN